MNQSAPHVFFARELEGVATFWRIFRRDGAALGFTAHDRDLWFGGLRHRAAPGMVAGAIRRSAGLTDDGADVEGMLAHDGIDEHDLRAGRYDEARVELGAVDWETLDHAVLYSGTIAALREDSGGFVAELRSAKAALERDPIPRVGPTCRARFCGPGCALSPAGFTRSATLISGDADAGLFVFDLPDPGDFAFGEMVWLDGPLAGQRQHIAAASEGALVLEHPLAAPPEPGTRARLREGCDRRLATCAARFGNAANFQGEPFVPGNDLLARYPLGG